MPHLKPILLLLLLTLTLNANIPKNILNHNTTHTLPITKIQHKDSSDTILQSFEYTVDSVGNRTQIIENTGRTTNYEYSVVNQLTIEIVTNDPNNQNTITTYSYDLVGNLKTKTVDNTTTTYSYNANDQLITQDAITFTYDSNGNVLSKSDSDTTTSYNYDDKNRLIKTITATDTIEYIYDANNNRVAKTTNSGTTTYLIDTNTAYAQLITESKDDGTTIEYTYGNDLINQSNSNQTLYYHTDALGSTRGLTDSNATLTDSYSYTPYGKLNHHSGTATNSFLYTGEQLDTETDDYYLRARYYSPSSGRFLSRDSYDGRICSPVTQNHYLYAASNPTYYIDPSGHSVLAALGRIGLQSMNIISKTVHLSFRTGGNSRRSFIKILACDVGVSYAKTEFYMDAKFGKRHGHHPFNTSMGAPFNQKLLFLPSNTHQMYHMILHYLIKMDPNLPNTGNWTSSKVWAKNMDYNRRQMLYSHIFTASKIVDKVCKLPYYRSLTKFVKMNRKDFLGY